MSALVRLDGVSLAFGDQTILAAADFSIDLGERVCMVGRNGAGKSTTLKLLLGEVEPDDGTIEIRADIRIGVLEQTLAEGSSQSVRDFVAAGMAGQLERIERYAKLSGAGDTPAPGVLSELEALERDIVAHGGWSIDSQIDATISQMRLPAGKRLDEISGGWRRRVALARALVSAPDLLLLDEPTNHLDITTIEWLEFEIGRYPGAVLFVTHDRSFVEHVATRIVDIDRGSFRSWPGGYADYVHAKLRSEAEEDRHNREFDKRLAVEEAWIRQGVKAREKRNEGRVRALETMRGQRAERVARPRTARIHINESDEVSGRKVIEVRNLTHGFGGKPLLENFSLRIMRGERIGIVGNNGVGKSTLLRLLLGEIEPDAGSVKLGTNLSIAYFDQLRRALDSTRSVAQIVGEGRDYILLNGQRKHVVAYLTDFLFTAKRARTPVGALSGGERNRVILAKLFTAGANLLVLDEPTNDLDVETLDALERRLADYTGTLIVVSHDRHFLDAVVTSTLVFEADGQIRRYPGGYADWARQGRALAVADEMPASEAPVRDATEALPTTARAQPRKLSYKLQRELDALPARIEALELGVAALQAEIATPEFYAQDYSLTQPKLDALVAEQQALEEAIERWIELESLADAARTPRP